MSENGFSRLDSAILFAGIGYVARPIKAAFFAPLSLLLKHVPQIQSKASLIARDDQSIELLERESIKLADSVALPSFTDHLVRGERKKAAEVIAPPEKFPHLYLDVPTDLRRSIIEDGRICTGAAPAVALAGSTLTPEFTKKAWSAATRSSIFAAYAVLLIWAIAAAAIALQAHKLLGLGELTANSDEPVMEAVEPRVMEPADMAAIAAAYKDIWTPKEGQEVLDQIEAARASVGRAARAGEVTQWGLGLAIFLAISTLTGLVAAGAAARIRWLGTFRFLVFTASLAGVEDLRHNWREALQRWRWRLPERDMLLSAYADQINFATKIDKSPLIDLGVSTGLLEHRGHLLAPLKDTPVRMSIIDMLQHVEVLGGSGEGKSRNFYVPVVRQLIQLRKQGYPISIYATDDKGAIGDDIVAEVKAAGLSEDEVLRIGTGPNDWRIDLCAGLGPVELAEIIRSVSAQMGGSASDDFWPEMASDLIAQIGVLLQAVELTDAGKAWSAQNQMRVHSILNLLRVAGSDDLIDENLQIMATALQDPAQVDNMAAANIHFASLSAALTYLGNSYQPLAPVTKDGIRANMRKALKAFAAKPELSSGFADGMGSKLLPPSALLEPKIKVINISQIEHGSAGRIVSIMLKTLLFKQARMAELKNPSFAKERLNWWFDPKPGAGVDKYALTFFLADEYQALATSSAADGLSDASVWNVLRSAGIGGIVLSQSVSAFRLAVGDAATENMRRNWRTKIILRTEDLDTIEEAKKLAGRAMRFHSMDWSHLESAAAARRETGVSADNLAPARWNHQIEGLKGSKHTAFSFPDFNDPYELDDRFIDAFGERSTKLASQQAAHWRNEDRNAAALAHGITEVEAVREEDLMQMGRGRALVYVQRAGGTRVDVIKLN